MSVFETLRKEHQLFRRLLERAEEAAARGDEPARDDLRQALLLLFPALEGHERVESAAFDPAACVSLRVGRQLAEVLRLQHEELEGMRRRLLTALESSAEASAGELRPLVEELAGLLRRHLEDEEERLWPQIERLLTRREGRTYERQVRAAVDGLAADLDRRRLLLDDYLGHA